MHVRAVNGYKAFKGLPGVFSGKRKKEEKDRAELYRQIGQLKVDRP